jgi:teichoic acid transport system permease protein
MGYHKRNREPLIVRRNGDYMNKRKKAVITIFLLLALILAGIIIAHNNPGADYQEELTKKILSCAVIFCSCIIFIKWYDKFTVLPLELYQNRFLIWKLAKNDFKKRYAGSYLGAVWALVQPVVTVAMYYIVFGVIMPNARTSGEIPFVLFLTAGLVPWFYFSEALTNGTNALLEYNYLVKKMVFKISILPIIKVIAASFIHVFFVCILLIVAAIYGYYPSIYTIQLVYYSLCMFVFVLALCYTTCAIVVIFRDLSQIINIALQIGMWATPILWNIDEVANPVIVTVLKLNPLVYVVNGYRSSIYGREWFFEDFFSTMYFWIVTVVLFGLGALVFKRLKVHFADVL